MKIRTVGIMVFVISLSSCTMFSKGNNAAIISEDYIGSAYQGNYVWAWTMNLAWNDLRENIVQEKIDLIADDKNTIRVLHAFNNPFFTKDDLDTKSYYIKSGSGQYTIDTINMEAWAKFPSKSIVDVRLAPEEIISYAYFFKEIAYKTAYTKKDISFEWNSVHGFSAKDSEQRKGVRIVAYENYDKFIITLPLKDDDDSLILAKGYEMNSPESVVRAIQQNKHDAYQTIAEIDVFAAPLLRIDHHREYPELTGKNFGNKNLEHYRMAQMFENIQFDMGAGAWVENDAIVTGATSPLAAIGEAKSFLLDKPYWVIMQKKDSVRPYFIIGVNNPQIMESTSLF